MKIFSMQSAGSRRGLASCQLGKGLSIRGKADSCPDTVGDNIDGT